MQLFLKRLKGDPVLLAAWGLALVSAFLVPPDREWLGYVDFHTLGLLFCLMLVMAGLQDIGFFQRLGEGILGTHPHRPSAGTGAGAALLLHCHAHHQ